jgi:hypothetical protein
MPMLGAQTKEEPAYMAGSSRFDPRNIKGS